MAIVAGRAWQGGGIERSQRELGASRRLPMTLGILRTCTRCGRVRQWTEPCCPGCGDPEFHFPTRTRAARNCGKGGIETERERLNLEVARSGTR